MDEVTEQLKVINRLSAGWHGSKKENIEEFLNRDIYQTDYKYNIPDQYYNPAIDGYLETHNLTENGWDNIGETDVLRAFPEYLPTDKLLEFLASIDSILEIGAGNGYWSHVINQNGGNCIPTDINPMDIDSSEIFPDPPENFHFHGMERPAIEGCQDFPCEIGRDKGRKIWCEVKYASHDCVLDSNASCALLCHPVKFTWVEELLDYLVESGIDKFILISEWVGVDATPYFYLRLDRNWKLLNTFPVIDWESMNVSAYVFSVPDESIEP